MDGSCATSAGTVVPASASAAAPFKTLRRLISPDSLCWLMILFPKKSRPGIDALLRFHVIAQEQVLIAKIEFTVSDHRVRPRMFAAAVGLLQAAGFLVCRGNCLD